MKHQTFTLILTFISAVIFMTSFDYRSPEKGFFSEIANHSHKSSIRDSKAYTAEKILMIKEWQNRWKESEYIFGLNHIKFNRWRQDKYTSGKTFDEFYDQRIDSLEMMNQSLQTMIETYELKLETWQSFKVRFDLLMDKLEWGVKQLEVDYHY